MKKSLIFLYITSILATIFIIIFCSYSIFKTITNFVGKTNHDIPYFYNTITTASKNNNFATHDSLNILLLGLDERNDWLEKTSTTDTILIANLNFKTQKIKLISLPRDLWSFDQKAKINSIYQTSIAQSKDYNFIKSEYQKIIGQNIDKILIINTNNLIDFVKIIGPVTITMDMDYTDTQYPNPEYINNPKSGASIYKTVEFKKGDNIIDSTNVTEFVRSRKGAQTAAAGGTDLGRINRQQLLINAIAQKIKTSEIYLNPQKYVDFYNLWQYNFKTDLTDSDLASLVFKFKDNLNNLKIEKIDIPISEVKTAESVIYHPQSTKFTKQWIYLPTSNTSYQSIQDFITKSLTN